MVVFRVRLLRNLLICGGFGPSWCVSIKNGIGRSFYVVQVVVIRGIDQVQCVIGGQVRKGFELGLDGGLGLFSFRRNGQVKWEVIRSVRYRLPRLFCACLSAEEPAVN